MEGSEGFVAPSVAEVVMVEPELVRQIRELAARGWRPKRIAREVVAEHGAPLCAHGGAKAGVQERPGARRLTAEPEIETGALAHLGRSLADYAAAIEVAR
jgi:hypothetical protein